MIFKNLRIRRLDFGTDIGKLEASLNVEGKTAEMTVKLNGEVAQQFLLLGAKLIADNAAEMSAAFRNEFLAAIVSQEKKE
jgi:hypothetical protein